MTGVTYVHAVGVVSALGVGLEQTRAHLFSGDRSGLVVESGWLPAGVARVGKVGADLACWPERLAVLDCRNNRLLVTAIEQVRPVVERLLARFGAQRVGVVIGTSTSGIAAGETAVEHRLRHGHWPPEFQYAQQEFGSAAPAAAAVLGARGPAYTVSTACTSGAKALAAARNLLSIGCCDVVVAGGVDSLCRMTVAGFAALESTTAEHCNPMSRNRAGINIGEAAAVFVLTREPADIALFGVGETSDAHHISAPDPSGRGAEGAIRAALADARLGADHVGYVNLHATATQKNDAMESRVMARVFGAEVPMSGTKPLTGHALGAAGALEAAICWLALREGGAVLPPHCWDGEADPDLPALNLVGVGQGSGVPLRYCMSNNFAFGGNNVSLVLGLT